MEAGKCCANFWSRYKIFQLLTTILCLLHVFPAKYSNISFHITSRMEFVVPTAVLERISRVLANSWLQPSWSWERWIRGRGAYRQQLWIFINAFDKVWSLLLVSKLVYFGSSCDILSWILNVSSNRTQRVVWNKHVFSDNFKLND